MAAGAGTGRKRTREWRSVGDWGHIMYQPPTVAPVQKQSGKVGGEAWHPILVLGQGMGGQRHGYGRLVEIPRRSRELQRLELDDRPQGFKEAGVREQVDVLWVLGFWFFALHRIAGNSPMVPGVWFGRDGPDVGVCA